MCKNVERDSSTVCVDPCVSARRRLSGRARAWSGDTAQDAESPPAPAGSGARCRCPRRAPGSPTPHRGGWGSGGGPGRARAAVVIARSSLGVCGEGAGM